MLAPLLAGSMVGTLLLATLPQPVLAVALFLVLAPTTLRTARQGVSLWRQETRTRAAEAELDGLRVPLLPAAAPPDTQCDVVAGEADEAGCAGDALLTARASADEVIDGESGPLPPLLPRRELRMCAVCWAVVLFFAVARGGHGAPSLLFPALRCGTPAYWALLLTAVAALGVLTHAARRGGGAAPPPGAPAAAAASPLLPAACFAAGTAAGTLGIGGGMLFGPILLEIGCHPSSAAATGALLVLLADTSVLAQLALSGALRGPLGADGVELAAAAAAATALGQAGCAALLRRTSGSASVIVLLIAAVTGASTCLLGGLALARLSRAGGGAWRMRPLC